MHERAQTPLIQPDNTMDQIAAHALYGVEWLAGVICWGATADRLSANGCYFGKFSNCGTIIFIGAVAWLALSWLIAMRVLPHLHHKFAHIQTKSVVERYLCLALAGAWALVALIAAATAPMKNRRTTGDAVIGFAWFNLVAHLASFALFTVSGADNDRDTVII